MDLSAPEVFEPSLSARSNPIAEPSSPSTGQASPATRTSEPSQPLLFPETELPLTSSAAGSRARISRSLENELALKVRDLAAGQRLPVSLASFDPDTSSWRPCQACLVSGWERFSEAFPRSGTMRRGTVYQLAPSAPLTDEIAFGLLPTPEASNTKAIAMRSGGREPRNFLLPTPTAKANMLAPSMQKWKAHRNLWPTPTAVTDTGGAAMCKWGGSGARAKLRKMVTPQELNGSLNPTWVEWLQGFPLGWTEVE